MESVEKLNEVFEGLEETSLRDSYFEKCTFRRCRFTSLSLKNCRFIDCSFENCELSLANLTGSRFANVIFSDCKAIGMNWGASAGLQSPKFIRCKLNDASFSHMDLRYICFEECEVEGADFSNSRLDKAQFSQCRLAGASFQKSILVDADFSSSQGYFFDPRQNTLKNTKVSLPEAMGLLEVMGATLVGFGR